MDSNLQTTQKSSRSEIKRYVYDSITNERRDYRRFSYYTLLVLSFEGITKRLQFKLDTGSPRTVIGLDLLKRNGLDLTEEINKTGLQDGLKDASDNDIRVAPYIVQSFKLTDEITLNNVLVYISPDIKSRAVLGMDILSLFDFQYKWEVNSMIGTFWINNYAERKKFIDQKLKEKGQNILDSKQMFLLDEKSKRSTKYTEQDILANDIYTKLQQNKIY